MCLFRFVGFFWVIVGWNALACAGADNIVLLGREVAESQQVPVEQISHAAWDRLLKKFVDSDGFVDYSAVSASAEDQRTLDEYLNRLSTASVTARSPRNAVLAFWINAYNAVTLKGILREYPTTSIRNHTSQFFGYNIWKHLLLRVGTARYSLDDMEHRILRPKGEPRIHFAIVCASVGCPRLLNEAYTADSLDAQLTANARHFFADETKFRVDSAGRHIQVSPILDWFGGDFGPDTAARMQAIAAYVPEAGRVVIEGGDVRVSFLEYNWALNDRKTKR